MIKRTLSGRLALWCDPWLPNDVDNLVFGFVTKAGLWYGSHVYFACKRKCKKSTNLMLLYLWFIIFKRQYIYIEREREKERERERENKTMRMCSCPWQIQNPCLIILHALSLSVSLCLSLPSMQSSHGSRELPTLSPATTGHHLRWNHHRKNHLSLLYP